MAYRQQLDASMGLFPSGLHGDHDDDIFAPAPVPLLAGDAYREEPGGATRSVVLAPLPPAGHGESPLSALLGHVGKPGFGKALDCYEDEACPATHWGLARDFHLGDAPRRLPTEPLFRLEATTLFVHARSAHLLGNMILGFLRDGEVVCSRLQVKHSKFSMKAEVFNDGSSCGMKLRVYAAADQGLFVVELQRRRGDAVTFARLFRKLAGFLSRRGLKISREHSCGLSHLLAQDELRERDRLGYDDDHECPSSPIASADVDLEGGADLSPLFDLAGHAQLRAEAAAALAREVAAEASRRRPGARGQGPALRALTKLLSAGGGEVALQAATAVRHHDASLSPWLFCSGSADDDRSLLFGAAALRPSSR